KPVLYAANVKETELSGTQAQVERTSTYAQAHAGCDMVVFCAQLESELTDLPPSDAAEYLQTLGLKESAVPLLIRPAYRLLGLRTFFTFNEKEVRAWPIRAGTTASRAAGTIHTDFERGFVKAETVNSKELIRLGSVSRARETGHYRIEGRDYEVEDGDVLLIRFNV